MQPSHNVDWTGLWCYHDGLLNHHVGHAWRTVWHGTAAHSSSRFLLCHYCSLDLQEKYFPFLRDREKAANVQVEAERETRSGIGGSRDNRNLWSGFDSRPGAEYIKPQVMKPTTKSGDLHTHTRTQTHTCARTNTYTCTRTNTRACTCACANARTNTCTHTNTHTH